jgi:uncharacterized protein involved in type VI secretion and phage assembly
MIHGAVVGIVEDNHDPSGMHRVKVRFPVDSDVQSSWVRMTSPMAGEGRGLVILPDVGTEVVMLYCYRSLAPVIVGAVYNGGNDPPEPYHNDDGNNDRRVFWSRSGNMVDFDDTKDREKVGIGSMTTTRLKVESAPVHHVFDSSEEKITQRSSGTTFYQVSGRLSIKCGSFSLDASNIRISAGSNAVISGKSVALTAGTTMRASSPDTQVKTPASPPSSTAASSPAPALHLPKVA